jgi:hypothetical protein
MMTTVSGHATGGGMTNVWRVPRTRGGVSGALLVLLGLWAGLVPFVGPYLGYAYTPASVWTFTWPRLWLEILPAAALLIGGLGLLGAAHRATGALAGWLAAAGGLWLVVGPSLSMLWGHSPDPATAPTGASPLARSVQEIGFFYGVGAVALLFAALALGRFTVAHPWNARSGDATTAGGTDTTPARGGDDTR